MIEEASFTRMDQGTSEDYALLRRLYRPVVEAAPDELLAMLQRLAGDKLGWKIDRYQHSLQTATRAFRDGADDETVVCALLHDVGDILGPDNHAELAAAVLRPHVSAGSYWLVKHHGIFQGYHYFHHVGLDRMARERFRGHPMFERTARFTDAWDQLSFDPGYDTMPLSAFEPMVRRVFSVPPFSLTPDA